MNRILIDLPEVIETSRLKLQMPCAGFGNLVFLILFAKASDQKAMQSRQYMPWLCLLLAS